MTINVLWLLVHCNDNLHRTALRIILKFTIDVSKTKTVVIKIKIKTKRKMINHLQKLKKSVTTQLKTLKAR